MIMWTISVYGWLREGKPGQDTASCLRTIDVSTMGSSAKCGTHRKNVLQCKKSVPINFFCQSSSTEKEDTTSSACPLTETSSNSSSNNSMQQTSLSSYSINMNVREAEILWVLRTVLCHDSCRSCDNVSKLFSRMFNDSEIAKSFSVGRTKCGYMINFGIAPYFKKMLLEKLKLTPFFVCYDESMNRIFQEEQMDIVLRFFNENTGQVETRYFDSRFLKRPNSINLLDILLEGLSPLDMDKMIQLSMDGPNVNWDVLKRLSLSSEEKDSSKLINIGSCGLHVVHGALQTGTVATGWDINKVLHAMWKIFDESPARRDVF